MSLHMPTERALTDVMARGHVATAPVGAGGEVGRFVRTAAVFLLIGVALYIGVYAVSERLVYQYAKTNKFYLVKTAPAVKYDYVVLGASHAAALGYQDMTARLGAMTGKRIINLALRTRIGPRNYGLRDSRDRAPGAGPRVRRRLFCVLFAHLE
jgi:hypothetical protein